jgi:hypothetical protein
MNGHRSDIITPSADAVIVGAGFINERNPMPKSKTKAAPNPQAKAPPPPRPPDPQEVILASWSAATGMTCTEVQRQLVMLAHCYLHANAAGVGVYKKAIEDAAAAQHAADEAAKEI